MVLLIGIHKLVPKASQMRGHVNACHQSVFLFVTKCPHACQHSDP